VIRRIVVAKGGHDGASLHEERGGAAGSTRPVVEKKAIRVEGGSGGGEGAGSCVAVSGVYEER
jgi:hypothetical protein